MSLTETDVTQKMIVEAPGMARMPVAHDKPPAPVKWREKGSDEKCGHGSFGNVWKPWPPQLLLSSGLRAI